MCIPQWDKWKIILGLTWRKLRHTHVSYMIFLSRTSSLDQITFKQELCSKASCWQMLTNVVNFSSTYFYKRISNPVWWLFTRTYALVYDMQHTILYEMNHIKSKLWSWTIFCAAFNYVPITETFIAPYHSSISIM